MSKLFLFALSCFPNPKGMCHRTILMRGINEQDARSAVYHKLKSEGSWDCIGRGVEQND